MNRRLMNALLFFPSRAVADPSRASGLTVENLRIDTSDGERLHGWWAAAARPARGHVLLCPGNAGNVASRGEYARLLNAAGFDVLLFDYRGYGRSSGRPGEFATYRDARAARAALLGRPGIDPRRVLYLGESLGAAVALELALEHPPAGVVLQSAFTSVRDMARAVYPFIPRAIVPDAYPSLRRIPELRAPLLVLHAARDELVPLAQGRAVYDAARVPKRMEVFPDARHNELLLFAGPRWARVVAEWADEVMAPPEPATPPPRAS